MPVLPRKVPISDTPSMNKSTMFKRYRFPPEIIQCAVWRYFRFNLSHPDVEDLLDQRGIIVTRESLCLWCNKFGSKFSARLRRKRLGMVTLTLLMASNVILGES